MKKLINSLLFLFIVTQLSAATSDPYSKRMADAQMARSGTMITWDYPNGLFAESVLKVYNYYGGSNYYNYVLNHAKTVVSTAGKITGYSFTAYTLDNINPGQFLMQIYATEKTARYKIALDTLRKQISQQPRTNNSKDGGYWHKNVYPHQMWLDGLYMGTRFYANYDKTYNNGTGYDDIVNQFKMIHAMTYDPNYQLNYHAWSAVPTDANSFWANKTDPFKGCSKEFWGRGLGWYFAALVDVIEILPEDYSRRNELVELLNQVASGLKRWQDPMSGCWFQLLRYDASLVSNGKPNYIEASSSSMFTYAFLKSLRLGLISKENYQTMSVKAYNGLINNFISEDTNGTLSLNRICRSAGLGPSSNTSRDGTIYYYLNGSDAGSIVSNDLKGVGPFIMASVEYEMYQAGLTKVKAISAETRSFSVSKNKSSININATSELIDTVKLYSVQGKEIFQWAGKDRNELKIPLSMVEKGIYIVKINDIFTQKIMI